MHTATFTVAYTMWCTLTANAYAVSHTLTLSAVLVSQEGT